MNILERRDFSRSHAPEWVTKGLSKQGNNPLKEGGLGLTKGFVLAFLGKAALAALFGVLGRKKKLMDVLREAAGMDTLRFALFYGLWNGVLRITNALVSRARDGKDDRLNAAISGMVAGLALLVDDVERRRTIAIYTFVRAMSVLVKALSREQKLPYWEHAESALFGLINGPIIYSFLLETDLLDQGYYRWILNMGQVTHEGLYKALRERREVFQKTGVMPPFCTCQPHYHTGPCVVHCTTDWVKGLGRAAKIYAPVHILPLLLFRYHKLLKNPQETVLDTSKNLLYSCMFLSTYVFNVKFTQCMLRNTFQQDTPLHALLGGFLTGFACLFERPSRVSELMLYCVPKSGEVVWNYGARYYNFKPIPYFELPLFMVGGAILLSALKEDLKSTYFNALKFAVTQDYTSPNTPSGRAGGGGGTRGRGGQQPPIPPTEEEEED